MQVWWELPDGRHHIKIKSVITLMTGLLQKDNCLPSPMMMTFICLVTALEAAMKSLRSTGRGLSGIGSSPGFFLLSLATFFPLALEGPATACYY